LYSQLESNFELCIAVTGSTYQRPSPLYSKSIFSCSLRNVISRVEPYAAETHKGLNKENKLQQKKEIGKENIGDKL
jgi:hypothetical protein